MAIYLASWHTTCSASKPLGELAVNCSPLFNNGHLLNMYEIMCLYMDGLPIDYSLYCYVLDYGIFWFLLREVSFFSTKLSWLGRTSLK